MCVHDSGFCRGKNLLLLRPQRGKRIFLVVQMLARVKAIRYLEHMFNGICFNREPRLTALSTAFDLAFGVQGVRQHVVAFGFGSASWQRDQTRTMKDGTQPPIHRLAGFLLLAQRLVLPWASAKSKEEAVRCKRTVCV